MKSILEDLFLGKINVMESLPFREKEIHVSNEALFIKTLTPEQKEQYENIQNIFRNNCTLENQDCFITGFKMGAQMMLECLSDSTEEPS